MVSVSRCVSDFDFRLLDVSLVLLNALSATDTVVACYFNNSFKFNDVSPLQSPMARVFCCFL